MSQIKVLFLWHQHQPFYKDLVSGEYRLPWVRMHALKDYYGMVKLLDEFPEIHATFNLVPCLIAQIQDYAVGTARDPFLEIARKPAVDLSEAERRLALRYFFQANETHMIARYPRYQELREQCRGKDVDRAEKYFRPQDFTDLQVLSQIAWFDEFHLRDPEVSELVKKGRNFSYAEQQAVIEKEKEFIRAVLPAHKSAAERGLIEISASPFYHPILPLLCDSNIGRESNPGLSLPAQNFRHPEDATEQLKRGLELHEQVFGVRPRGIWPSEGGLSEEVVILAHRLGVQWMASDEGVLGRTLNFGFQRNPSGKLIDEGPEKLYNIYRYERGDACMHLVFRDHSLSDLIGFVYAGVPAKQAADHFIKQLKLSTHNMVKKGDSAVVSIILDGENAWESYPFSGREFLRRLYARLQDDEQMATLTISQAIRSHKAFRELHSLAPGSWINANFNVWIGAPEDNISWNYLAAARDFYEQHTKSACVEARQLAFEEMLIAEGSDWNWWYGPEHHSANDADFDELYRKHLSNVYQALGAKPPDYLAQPIAGRSSPASQVTPQTAFISPPLRQSGPGYFDWIGSASYIAERHGSAMHGQRFLLEAAYAGVDARNLYGRLDFARGELPSKLGIVVNCETETSSGEVHRYRLEMRIAAGELAEFVASKEQGVGGNQGEGFGRSEKASAEGIFARLNKVLEFKLPLQAIHARLGDIVRLRFSAWDDKLPLDALPRSGWMDVPVRTEEEFMTAAERGW